MVRKRLAEVFGYGRRSDLPNTRVATQKSKAQLLGLVEGILADGAVVPDEAHFLRDWIDRNYLLRDEWPGSVLFPRLEGILADGVIDVEEHRELYEMLCSYVQIREEAERATSVVAPPDADTRSDRTVDSPFDDPVPTIEYMGRWFTVTGDFACAKRSCVVGAIEALGGTIAANVSRKTHFLLVGTAGSELWKGGNWGTKIESAIELKRAGVPIAIVRECDWHPTVPAEHLAR